MDHEQTKASTARQTMPDLARAISLVGIALVNVAVISYPLMGAYIYGGLNSAPDNIAYFAVNALFLMKTYTLFAFMFGVGFAYQIQSAQRAGVGFHGRYFRRIVGLALLGLLNIAFLFQGDILVMYAILGSLLYLFRNASVKALMIAGFGFYFVQILAFVAITLALHFGHQETPDDMASELSAIADTVARSHAIYGDGTFAQAIALRLREWSEIIEAGIVLDGTGAMAFFLFGFAAVKSGIIADPSAQIWKRFRTFFLPIGLLGSALAAYVQSLGDGVLAPISMLGMTLIALFSLFSTAGYLGLIARWAAGPTTRFKAFLAKAGSASLTAYLLQGLFLSLIFNAYGLAYYAQLGAFNSILIALAVSIVTICITGTWRSLYVRGPFEYVLRLLTYWGQRGGGHSPTQ